MSHSLVGRRSRRDVLLAVGLGMTVACTATAAASAQALEVVAGGLANPRGMTFGPDGRLYVAEAGRGGPGACIPSPEGGDQCFGATGAITRVNVRSGRTRQVVSRLPSLAVQPEVSGDAPGGENAIGPQDVSFSGQRAYFTVGLSADPNLRSQLGPRGGEFAGLYRLNRRGRVRRVADLGAYEIANNPDARLGGKVDTNPFSVDASIRERILVSDAGGNDLLLVQPGGRVSTRAVFPFGQTVAPPFLGLPPGTEIPYQPVPTGIVRVRPYGVLVGQLTGFPFPVGKANVYQVASRRTVKATGFTTIVDVAFHNNHLYVLQISSDGLAGPPSPGKLIKVFSSGRKVELAAGKLTQPSGLTVAENGDVYVSNNGGSGDKGEIVRIPAGG